MAGVLDPPRQIVDPHHHLWSGDERGTYLLERPVRRRALRP